METTDIEGEDEMSVLKTIFDSLSSYLPACKAELAEADTKVKNAFQSIQNTNNTLFAYEDDEFPEYEYPFIWIYVIGILYYTILYNQVTSVLDGQDQEITMLSEKISAYNVDLRGWFDL